MKKNKKTTKTKNKTSKSAKTKSKNKSKVKHRFININTPFCKGTEFYENGNRLNYHGQVTFYYNNGNIRKIQHYQYGVLHNELGPAEITYYEEGTASRVSYIINGRPSKYVDFNVIYYYRNGLIKDQLFYNNYGKPSNGPKNNTPSRINYYRDGITHEIQYSKPIKTEYDTEVPISRTFFPSGILMKEEYWDLKLGCPGRSCVTKPFYIEYYENGQICREDYHDRSVCYFNDGAIRARTIHYSLTEPSSVEYNLQGNKVSESWNTNPDYSTLIDGYICRTDGQPAFIEYYENGSIKTEVWYYNDSQYNIFQPNDPSYITYRRDSSIITKEFTNENGEPHNEYGPCTIYYGRKGNIRRMKFAIHGHYGEFDPKLEKQLRQQLKYSQQFDQQIQEMLITNLEEHNANTNSN